MKKNLLTAVYMLLLLFCVSVTAQNDNDKLKASRIYRKMFDLAHPVAPLQDNKHSIPFMLSVESEQSNFLNAKATVNEAGQYQMQNESSIAVNPVNPNILIASAVDYRDTSAAWIYLSIDAGKTWKNIKLGRPCTGWLSSNDPSVAFDAEGTGYMVYGGFGTRTDTLGQLFGENGVFISKTTDFGSTWKAHNIVIVHKGVQTLDSTFEDKYYIQVDNSTTSSYFKNLYIPWKRVTPRDSATQIVISKSSDKGETWTIPVPVSNRLTGSSEDTTFGQSFPLAATGPNGEVFVVWNYGPQHAVGFNKSLDGGKTFSTPKIIQRYNTFGKTRYNRTQGWKHTVKGVIRAESYPTMVCDLTNGPRRGWLYLCWPGDSVPNIYFSRSSDGGDNWSAPVKVHKDITTDHFWPWISIDPTTGDIAVMYFDSRNDSSNKLVDCYVSYSNDGGTTWIDRRVSDISSDLRLNPFGDNSFAGDYNGCCFYNGKIYPSWVDMRNAVLNVFNSDVYTGIVNIRQPDPPDSFTVKINPAKNDQLDLSWKIPTKRVFGQKMDTTEFHYTLFRNGNYVTALKPSVTSYNDKGLTPHLEYEYSIFTVAGLDTSLVIKGKAFPGGSKNPGKPEIVNIFRDGDSIIKFNTKIPAFREDGVTPFTDLAEYDIYIDSVLVHRYSISPSEAGNTELMADTLPVRGFYSIMVTVRDIAGNESAKSNAAIIYSGKIESTFDEQFQTPVPAKYLLTGTWGITDKFYHSSPYSITDSPSVKYDNNSNYSFTIFPVKSDGKDSVNVIFYHAAIINRTDTGFVEISKDIMKTWETIGKFNKTFYAPWNDGTNDANDWKYEQLKIGTGINDTVYIRFRLYSGLSFNDDGWYIDDISVGTPGVVGSEAEATENLFIYPNLANNFVNLFLGGIAEENIAKIEIINLYGQTTRIEDNKKVSGSRQLSFDLSGFPQGYYIFSLTDKSAVKKQFQLVIIR